MVWEKIIGHSAKKEGGSEGSAVRDFERMETAFAQMTNLIKENKEFSRILEHAARESLYCLLAHRSSVFEIDGSSGVLNSPFSVATNPQFEQVGMLEEKEIARRAIRQNKIFLLRDPKDFSEFFKYGERDRKITSLITIPLLDQGKPTHALSVVLIDGSRRFHEKDLEFLSIFANQVLTAAEMSFLRAEIRKAADFRNTYEKYLDDILSQLQSLQENERQRIDGHIIKLLPDDKTDESPSPCETIPELETPEDGEGLEGVIFILDDDGNLRSNGGGEKVRIEFEQEELGLADANGFSSVFVRTPNPMDLGDLFLLKLSINDGREPITVQGKVIWTNKYGQDKKNLRRGMGVKLLKMQAEEQKRIEAFANKIKITAEKSA
jgi:Tfp pilus assembly protein PilZ